MNIHKSRLAALVGLMLMVCMMVAMLVVPASAATFETKLAVGIIDRHKIATSFYEMAGAELHGHETYSDLAVFLGFPIDSSLQGVCSPDGNAAYANADNLAGFVDKYNTEYPETPIEVPYLPEYTSPADVVFYKITALGCVSRILNSNYGTLTYTTTGKLVDSLGDSSLSGVLNQIIELLPIVIPVLIGFIGLNKAIKFITGVLHSA